MRFDLINLAAAALIAWGATARGFHPSPRSPTTAQGGREANEHIEVTRLALA